MEEKFIEITNSVYNVLEFFPYEDPLKTKAKEKALAIVENSTLLFSDSGWVSLKECFSGDREKIKFQIIEDIDILLNCLKLAKLQGWISSINFLIISNEYEKIKKKIKPKGNPIFRSIELINLPKKSPNASNIIKPKREVFSISERQKKIIKVLEKEGKAQVMDFQKVLGDITKRTIRRDLDELLKMGKIKREGEFNQIFYKISNSVRTNLLS